MSLPNMRYDAQKVLVFMLQFQDKIEQRPLVVADFNHLFTVILFSFLWKIPTVKKNMHCVWSSSFFAAIRAIKGRPKRPRTRKHILNSGLCIFPHDSIITSQCGANFKEHLMNKTLLHFNYQYCCSQAVFAPLNVLSRQTTRCTNNVFDRAISHRSDLGSFYQVMNTLKRLHCFPEQYLYFLAEARNTAILSTLKRKKQTKKKIMPDCRFQQIHHSIVVWKKKKRYEFYLLSLKGHQRRPPSWNGRSWQSSPSLWDVLGGSLIKIYVFW